MNCASFYRVMLVPARAWFLANVPGVPCTDNSDVLMLAIAGQESAWTFRHQVGGPAVGFWQFEKGGGIQGVLTHPASRNAANAACQAAGVLPNANDVYNALPLPQFDTLAFAFARLLLWTDSTPLPNRADVNEGWNYYNRNWRPGAPHPSVWAGLHQQANTTVP
jgi:hypothetical protein